MLKNYFKTSFRSLLKNPLSSFINTLGLALAIGCCMVVYAYLSLEFGMEDQHLKKDRIFMVTSEVNRDGEPDLFGIAPAAIGLQLKQDFPQITHQCRIEDRSVIVKKGDQVFREWTRMVDPEFMEIFDFELVKGDINSIQNRDKVIINEKIATKYFGDEDPTGKILLLKFAGESGRIQLEIGAVVKVDQTKTSFDFNFLTNYELRERFDENFKTVDWSENINAVFVMTESASDAEKISDQLASYPAIVNSAQKDWEILAFSLEPLTTLYDRSKDIRWDISRQSDVEGQVILSIIAILMIVLACVNYLNIAIASAVKRLKEIGIRKVTGANRGSLITLFMIENLFQTFIALVIGVVLGAVFFVPGMGNLFGLEMGLEVMTLQFWVFIIGLLLFTAVASGAYPALYVSRFQVVSILKGKLLFGRRNLLSKIFMTFQFIIACVAVSCGIFFTLNTEYQEERPWGYEKESRIMIPTREYDKRVALENRISQLPSVEAIAASRNHLGYSVSTSVIELPDAKKEVERIEVDERYIEVMGLELEEGRIFREDYESDRTAVVVNQTFVKRMEWDDALLKTFRFDSVQYTVIGVLKDFHYRSFWSDINPIFFRMADTNEQDILVVKTKVGKEIETYEEIEAIWSDLFPEAPFNGDYQSDLFADYFRNVNGHKVLMISVAVIALVMTCLGLFGLVSLNVSSRVKEFSVRKVLGANWMALTKAISSHFSLFLVISLAIGGPLSYVLVKTLFGVIYKFHMAVTPGPILVMFGLIVATVVVTVSSHLLKVTKTNPTVGLRAE